MMTYTRSAIGLLTRQYRSVLKKCFLINCGVFALGVLNASETLANYAPAAGPIVVAEGENYGNIQNLSFQGINAEDDEEIMGGVITNEGTIGNITGEFVNNSATIVNEDSNADGEINASIIYNKGNIGNISANFSNNTATAIAGRTGGVAGMIFNIEGTTGDIKGEFSSNTFNISGKDAFTYGLIGNLGTMGALNSDFKNNTLNVTAREEGGAYSLIFNDGAISDISGNFSDNTLNTTAGEGGYSYGIIFSDGENFDVINSTFTDNKIVMNSEDGFVASYGGPIVILTQEEGADMNIINSSFVNNTVVLGAAIAVSSRNLNVIAQDGYEAVISGNYVEDNYGKRYYGIGMGKDSENVSADLTIQAKTQGSVTIDDQIISRPYIKNSRKQDEATGAYYYVDENDNFFTDEQGNKLAKTNEWTGLLENDADLYLLDAVYSTVTFTGDGTGAIRLHNDVKDIHANVKNTTLDIGTSTVNVKDINFAADSTLALRIDSLDSDNAYGEHGRLNAADSMTIESGAKLEATLSQKAMANANIGDSGEVTLLTLKDAAITNNTFSDSTAEEDVSGNALTPADNKMYSFAKKADGSGTYIVTKIADAKTIADDEEDPMNSENVWVGDAAGAWVDSGSFIAGSVAADVADKLADLAQHDGRNGDRTIRYAGTG